MEIKSVKELKLAGKRVFLRADLNVPLKNGEIKEEFKLTSTLPTIDYIIKNGGKIILGTHLGRPDAQSEINYYDQNLSTQIIEKWFKEKNYKIKLVRDLLQARTLSYENADEILLLENLRFFNGEKGNLEEQEKFCSLLKDLADLYVNDAFGLIHRTDCSVNMLPKKFAKNDKAFGLLVEKEIKELSGFKKDKDQPFVLILGGNKISDKIPLLESFLEIKEDFRPQTILIGGAIAYTFLKSMGVEIGKSITDESKIEFAKNFLAKAKEKNIDIILPEDHIVTKTENLPHTSRESAHLNEEKTYYISSNQNFSHDETGIDIGPETIKTFFKIITSAKKIFINGAMGIYENQASETGTKKTLQAVGENKMAKTVAGGGDCVAACFKFNIQNKVKFLSTGGGATLKFIATKNPIKELTAIRSVLL